MRTEEMHRKCTPMDISIRVCVHLESTSEKYVKRVCFGERLK